MDIKISKSDIHGSGCFAVRDFAKSEIVNDVFKFKIKYYLPLPNPMQQFTDVYKETLGGRFTNHSINPNCEVIKTENGLALKALKDIAKDEEITANYQQLIDLFEGDETLVKLIKFW